MPKIIDLEAASVEELVTRAYEHAYAQGWTDGLPIIPASLDTVRRFVAASGRDVQRHRRRSS